MRLSVLRSWRSATDNDLIIRPSLVSSAPARLSCRYHTHATWPRKLSPAPFLCTFVNPGTSHQSPECPSRSFHSQQEAAEKAAPQAVSSTPANTATGFQARRLRARQVAEANASEAASQRLSESQHRKREPAKAKRRKNTKLKKATRPSQKASLRKGTEPVKVQEKENQGIGRYSSAEKGTPPRFWYWGPAAAADAVHFEALQLAHRAAQKAEKLARQAEEAAEAASIARGSRDEADAIQKADTIKAWAEAAASSARQTAQYAAEKEREHEAISAELRADLEKQPVYWEPEHRAHTSNHKLRAVVDACCPICSSTHSLAQCAHLFKDLAVKDSTLLRRTREIFQDRLEMDDRFREAMSYISSQFTVSKGLTPEVVPLYRCMTDDAPASAIKYLQNFDTRIYFRSIRGPRRKFTVEHVGLPFNLQSGYYITTDDDGKPLAIVYPQDAPSNIATDPHFALEIQKFRSFTAHWRRGQKSHFGQDPFNDIPSISIIICTGRWHRTKTHSADPFRAVISLSITDEKLWNQGLMYRGIHIGTKDDKITSDYDWWSYAQLKRDASNWIETNVTPVHVAISDSNLLFAKGLLRATLRNVKEPVKPLLAEKVKGKLVEEQSQQRFKQYCRQAARRCIQKYGRKSGMFRLLNLPLRSLQDKEVCNEALQTHWVPSWETMMHLDQDKPELAPRPPPRTLRRQRLLRPRTPPNPTVPTLRPSSAKHGMRRIFPHDAGPEEEAVGSGTKKRAPRHPAAPRTGAKKYRMRSIFSAVSPYRRAVKSFVKKRGAKSRRRASSKPWSSKFQMRSILSPDVPPEAEPFDGDIENPVVAPASNPRPSRRRVPEHRAESNLFPLDTASEDSTARYEKGERSPGRVSLPPKSPRPQTPAYKPGRLLSALDFFVEPAAVDSKVERPLSVHEFATELAAVDSKVERPLSAHEFATELAAVDSKVERPLSVHEFATELAAVDSKVERPLSVHEFATELAAVDSKGEKPLSVHEFATELAAVDSKGEKPLSVHEFATELAAVDSREEENGAPPVPRQRRYRRSKRSTPQASF